jgi:tetratricopeptide (TPR) repeat protein/O-antigen ligase
MSVTVSGSCRFAGVLMSQLATLESTAVPISRVVSRQRLLMFGGPCFVCAVALMLQPFTYWSPAVTWAATATAWISVALLIVFHVDSVRPIDYLVIGLWLFEVVFLWASVYQDNGWIYLERLTVAVAVYLAFSRLRSGVAIASISALVCGIASFVGVSDIMHFVEKYEEWKALRFGSVGDVKRMLTSIDGTLSGEHYTMYLYLLAWALVGLVARGRIKYIARVAALIGASVSLLAGALSLSRGIYASIITGACCASVLLLRSSFIYLRDRSVVRRAFILLFGLGVLLSFRPDICRAVVESVTTNNASANRSVTGRLDLWKRSFHLATTRPVLGFGAGTFPLYGAAGTTHDRGDYVDRAFSLPVQLVFERGVLGLGVYSVFFVLLFWIAIKSMNRTEDDRAKWILGVATIGLVSLLVRDLSFSTLFKDSRVTIGAFSLIGLISREVWLQVPEQETNAPQISGRVVTMLGSLLFASISLIVTYRGIERARAEIYVRASVQAHREGDEEKAFDNSRQGMAVLSTPFYEAQTAMFLAKSAHLGVRRDLLWLSPQVGGEQLRVAREAINRYESSIREFSDDASWHHNLAWLFWMTADRASALTSARRAVTLEPNTALYRQSLALMLLATAQTEAAKDEVVQALIRSPDIVDSEWWQEISTSYSPVAKLALARALSLVDSDGSHDPIESARKARLYLEAGDWDTGEKLLSGALLELPGLSGAWRTYALVQARHQKWDEAADALQRALFLNSQDYVAYYALSRVTMQQDNKKAGVDSQYTSKTLSAGANRLHAFLRSPESARVYRKFQVRPTTNDDLALDGLLQFCMPSITSQVDKFLR